MALRFCDSFDHYATADWNNKWSSNSDSTYSLIGATGRNGNALRCRWGNQGVSKILDAQATWIVGFAWRAVTAVPAATPIISFYDGATQHIYLTPDGLNHLQIVRGGGTVLGTGATVITSGTGFHYIEMKVTISDTVGVASLKIDGATELNLTGIDTRNAGNATADRFYLSNVGANTNIDYDYDDLYVCDGTGATNNTFLGDVRVQAIFPSGDGNSSVLVGSDGNSVNNSLLVDETSPNSDTDYVESSTPGDKDTYAMGNVTPTAGTVFGVQMLPYAKKTDAGSRSIVSVTRLSTTEEDSAAKALAGSYTYLPDIRETKPGGGAWTITDVNAMEAGVKVNA